MTLFDNFPVSRWRAYLSIASDLRLPAYTGSMWRGLFGKALWEIACLTRERECKTCDHLASCAYPLLFEAPGSVLPWAGGSQAPSAWLVEPDTGCNQQYPAGSRLFVDFVLIGRGQSHLPLVVMAWQRGLAQGVGSARVVGHLDALWFLDGADGTPTYQAYSPEDGWQLSGNGLVRIPPMPINQQEVSIELQTPLRIKRNSDLIGPRDMDAGVFLDAVVRRTSLLARAHAGGFPDVDFHKIKTVARTLNMTATELHWQDWTRYSSRQNDTMQMGGLMGEIRLSGNLEVFWPFLHVAQWTHVGKATSFGLGRIRLRWP